MTERERVREIKKINSYPQVFSLYIVTVTASFRGSEIVIVTERERVCMKRNQKRLSLYLLCFFRALIADKKNICKSRI